MGMRSGAEAENKKIPVRALSPNAAEGQSFLPMPELQTLEGNRTVSRRTGPQDATRREQAGRHLYLEIMNEPGKPPGPLSGSYYYKQLHVSM